jgi:hypothetical protein
MAALDDRKKAFEDKFAHDETLKFKAIVRRNKLLGLWAAELMGKADPGGYARDVIEADFAVAGDEDVVAKISGDFKTSGIAMSDSDIRSKMLDLLTVATTEILNA